MTRPARRCCTRPHTKVASHYHLRATHSPERIRAARREAARIEAEFRPPLMTALSERVWFVLTVTTIVLAWALFGVAAVVASVYTASHPFRGYEWVGAFLMTLSLLGFCAMPVLTRPGLSDPAERSAHRVAVNIRTLYIVLLACGGFIVGAITAIVEWFAPPSCYSRSNAGQQTRGFHTSPSPSAAPTKSECGADPLVGTLVISQLALLCVAIACMWLSSEAMRRVEAGDDDDENAQF